MTAPYETIDLRERAASISLDLEEDHAGLTQDLRYEALERFAEIVSWFEAAHIPLSIFVSGNFLEKRGKTLAGLTFPEYHSHGYWHPPHAEAGKKEVRDRNIHDGLKQFESFFKRKAAGYRAPYGVLKEDDLPVLSAGGIVFDSSFFPGIHVSGCHLFRSSKPRWYPSLELTEIPISAHPYFRFPASMSYMQLTGPLLFSLPYRAGFGVSPLVFNFHLHDLVDTAVTRELSPFWRWIYRKGSPDRPFKRLTEWLLRLQEKGVTFLTMSQLHSRLLSVHKSG